MGESEWRGAHNEATLFEDGTLHVGYPYESLTSVDRDDVPAFHAWLTDQLAKRAKKELDPS